MDLCCGATRPLCSAFEALQLPVLPVDVLQDVPLDLMSDDVFDCQLLECAFEGGAQSDLEQPTNAMSWLESFVQAFLLRVHVLCVVTPACKWEMDIANSWMFASSSPLLHALAGTCTHGKDAHESIAGKRDPFGGFVSQQSATYPAKLAAAYAAALGGLLPAPQPCPEPLSVSSALSQIPLKPQVGPPTATQDGGGSEACLIGAFPLWVSKTPCRT